MSLLVDGAVRAAAPVADEAVEGPPAAPPTRDGLRSRKTDELLDSSSPLSEKRDGPATGLFILRFLPPHQRPLSRRGCARSDDLEEAVKRVFVLLETEDNLLVRARSRASFSRWTGGAWHWKSKKCCSTRLCSAVVRPSVTLTANVTVRFQNAAQASADAGPEANKGEQLM